ncbi:uncharacterized protein BP5553_06187 [Venustampulla echinocandica]|uniref:Carboxymuconolactone decarboxylase-like domain-containing protein n=1 Tax=Venustampulla echinocandica TaxID=2656787 RepID=A0A370TMU2_9HELO|nr:uncharacterized protein BP5553_06187 [Venustampulla echinocandica]RDL36835.1 hypothetical protein BP5553_06187 [Venustampulla echinocandica]
MSAGPWKLLRFVVRIVLRAILLWFLLALLWAFLPSPSREPDGNNDSDYSTAVLRAGKVLTRVYDSKEWHIKSNNRQAFALDYKLDIRDLTLSISGSDKSLPILNETPGQDSTLDITEDIHVVARIGDDGGANLPWFKFADAILLTWWLEKEDLNITLTAYWRREGEDGSLRRMELRVPRMPEPLLSFKIQGNDRGTITAITPAKPASSSPSMTYPIRVAIINAIAPTAVFVNDVFGSAIGMASKSVFNALAVIFIVGMYGFMLLAIVFSLWRCLGGPSFETTVGRMQDRLERHNENERYRVLRIHVITGWLDWLNHSERVQMALDICRHGWHPERERARRADEETDVERGNKAASLPEKGGTGARVFNTLTPSIPPAHQTANLTPKARKKAYEHKMALPRDSGVPTQSFHPDGTPSHPTVLFQNSSPPPLFPQPYSLSGRLLTGDNMKHQSSGGDATATVPLSQNNMDDPNHQALYEKGYEMRKKVVGEDYVAAALEKGSTDFLRPLQQFATESAWGTLWTRPGLEHKTRSLLNLVMLTALGKWIELGTHVRGAVRNGVSEVEIREALLQASAYCGLPAGMEAFRVADRVLNEMQERGEITRG